jgi:predicted MFS family arabinose efflux permease
LISYLVTFLHDELGVELVAAGFALAITQAGGMAGRVLWGYLADRFLGSVRALIVLSMVSAACALSIPFFRNLGPGLVTLGILAVFGACAVGWNGVYLAEVARQAPAGQTGVATGGTLAVTFMGVVVGPPLFGAVAAFSGSYGLAYATLIVPAGLCIWLLGSFRSALARRT